MKTMVKGVQENAEEEFETDVYLEESIEGFDGEEITENEFKNDMLNLVGQPIGIELRYKGCLITAKCYEDLEIYEDKNKRELVFDDNNGEIPFTALPLDDIDVICRGYGFFSDEDKWVIRLQGGLEYFIWLEI